MVNINAFNFDSPKKMKFDHCSAIKIVDILEKSINRKLPEDWNLQWSESLENINCQLISNH